MPQITKQQAQRLAEFIHLTRPEWRTPGILTAIEAAAPTAPALDLARALVNLAATPTVLTPALLARPGNHWRNPNGTPTPRRGDHNVRCNEHPEQHMPCQHASHHGTMTRDELAAAKAAALAAAAANPYTPPKARNGNTPLTPRKRVRA